MQNDFLTLQFVRKSVQSHMHKKESEPMQIVTTQISLHIERVKCKGLDQTAQADS